MGGGPHSRGFLSVTEPATFALALAATRVFKGAKVATASPALFVVMPSGIELGGRDRLRASLEALDCSAGLAPEGATTSVLPTVFKAKIWVTVVTVASSLESLSIVTSRFIV